MTATSILLTILGILNLIVGGLVLLRDPKRLMNLSFFGLAASAGAWVIGIAGFLATQDAHQALAWSKFYYFAPLAIVLSSMIFADTFPSNTQPKRLKISLVALALLLISVPLLAVPDFLTSSIVRHDWGKQVVLNVPEYLLYSFYVLVGFLMVIWTVYRRSQVEIGMYRAQTVSFLRGFALSAALGMFFNLILPGFGNYQLIALGPLATAFYVFTTAYSIVRHRLFNIRLVIARSLGYVLSLTVLAAIYGFLVFGAAKFIFKIHLEIETQLFLSVATGVAALSFSRLKGGFDTLTNSLFYRDAYNSQDLFDSLNRVLVSSLNLERLAHGTASVLSENLKSQFCLIGLKEVVGKPQRIIGTTKIDLSLEDIMAVRRLTVKYHHSVIVTDYLEKEKQAELKNLLTKHDIAVLVRLAPNVHKSEEGLGYIVLGGKKSGNPYTNQDVRVLDTVAKELIIAIQNALRFEEIQNFNETLQAKVVEATNKLRRTNEKLKALDETKDDFISMASHQLRTPLTSVKGYVSLVLDGDAGPIKPMQRQLLNQAFTSSQRMVYLISDLLNVSRLRTGKFVIESSQVNLADIITDEIGQLKETAAVRQVTIDYAKPKDFPDLMLDETKIRQVIMNYMDNAIYYTPTGGHMRVELVNNPATVELKVIDNGIGVPKHEQHHLFTKFYRAGNARKVRPDGTGLGLFMAKKVVTAQGGAVIFDSEEGKGSTFGFTFSKARLAEAATQPVKA